MNVSIDYSNCLSFLTARDISKKAEASNIHFEALLSRSGEGNNFTGWLDLPEKALDHVEQLNKTARELRAMADITVVTGIGGSYLGSKAIIEALGASLHHNKEAGDHKVLFAGQNLSENYHSRLLDYLSGKIFNIIVISKSGTTTEPAIAFRLLRKQLEENMGGEKINRHIIAITDSDSGALREMADKEAYASFIIPDDVGGRYSVLTPAGLLPIAVAGYDIRDFIKGFSEMAAETRDNSNTETNPAIIYASIRNLLYEKGKYIELLANYEPALHYLAEWWKQLFGESEGKDGKGIFPASADFTTDLHSLGQYIQDGSRILFETVLSVESTNAEVLIPADEDNLDNFNYLAGKRLSEINARAEEGTIMAHVFGGVPVIKITLPAINERYLGQLLYFFEISCALSGYMLGVNPFDQPGVEAYKSNMFRLLGKAQDQA
ncbi:MAG: glucose-6-phosphate isomerase [Bacteroidales bacterium]|jgi:glucose-6-phosphate isomerase|nr:glucose-6-phosphate isomerase [Bacteroidales bacterium]